MTSAEIRGAVEIVRRTGTINEIAPALVTVTDAALILVDLIDNGEVIEWCESHQARALIAWYLNRCPVGANTYENGCRMVPKLLVDRLGHAT